MYEERFYRKQHAMTGLAAYQVAVAETDLWISSERDRTPEVTAWVTACRSQVAGAEAKLPGFLKSLEPLPGSSGQPLVDCMLKAARMAGVGPMAAVAGAIAQHIGESLGQPGSHSNLCVENGGDIYMDSDSERTILIYAGTSPLSNRIGIRLRADQFPLGICTSAGTVGHSLSFGKADAAVVLSRNAALADAAATAAGNRLKTVEDMDEALAFLKNIPGIMGCVLIIGDRLGAWGDIELVPVGH